MILNGIMILLLGLLAYAWVGYPVLLGMLARRVRRVTVPAVPEDDLPAVAVLLSAFNEEGELGPRLENLLHIDYPAQKLTILVGTDGCTDRTADIAREWAARDGRIQLFEFPENRGKVSVLKDLAAECEGGGVDGYSFLVFTDANTHFKPDALKKLVAHFADARVGGVCGRLFFTQARGTAGEPDPAEEGFYWRWEAKLKERESVLDSCLGANGAIYAIRRELFWREMPVNTIVDDFVIGMKVRENGFRMVYEPSAEAWEVLPEQAHEWGRRVRIGAGAFQSLTFCARCLLPRYGVFAWAFWSHKVLRWFSGHMALALVALACGVFWEGRWGEVGVQSSEFRVQSSEVGGKGGRTSNIEHRTLNIQGKPTPGPSQEGRWGEDGGRRTEDGGKRGGTSNIEHRTSEIGRQRTEDRGRRSAGTHPRPLPGGEMGRGCRLPSAVASLPFPSQEGPGVGSFSACLSGGIILATLAVAALVWTARVTRRWDGRLWRFARMVDHFVMMNAALFVGFLRFCRGNLKGAWSRTPRGRV